MPQHKPLTPLELRTIIALARLGADAYAVPIRTDIKSFCDRSVSITAIYNALDRLCSRGLAVARLSEPVPERGGRARRHYRLTAAGREFVRRERESARRLWQGVSVESL
jgi:DNA-binding PadR family transcriptional regulator